jgi:hypothetical protein
VWNLRVQEIVTNVLEETAVSIFKIKTVGQAWKLVYNIRKGRLEQSYKQANGSHWPWKGLFTGRWNKTKDRKSKEVTSIPEFSLSIFHAIYWTWFSFSILKNETADSSKMLGTIYQTTKCYIPEDKSSNSSLFSQKYIILLYRNIMHKRYVLKLLLH